MSSSNLIRWCGPAAVTGGLLHVEGVLLQMVMLGSPSSPYRYLLSGLTSLLLLGAWWGSTPGKPTAAIAWARQASCWLSSGTCCWSCWGPSCHPSLPPPTTRLWRLCHLRVGGLSGILGLLLLGVATLQARALPLVIVLVSILSGSLWPALLPLDIRPDSFASVAPTVLIGVLLGIGWVLLGYALW